jgi:hypothetical protein
MQWPVMFFYTILGKQYKRAATDALFADGVLNLITLPIFAWFIEASFKDSYCFNNIGLYSATSNWEFGVSRGVFELFWLSSLVCVGVVAVDVFIFVSFFWPATEDLREGGAPGRRFGA